MDKACHDRYEYLRFLTNQSQNGPKMRGTVNGRRYYFDPKSLYEYMWICLNEGLGVRVWKTRPQMPPKDSPEESQALWYSRTAEKVEEQVRTKWNQGEGLGDQIPRWTLENLLGMNPVDLATRN